MKEDHPYLYAYSLSVCLCLLCVLVCMFVHIVCVCVCRCVLAYACLCLCVLCRIHIVDLITIIVTCGDTCVLGIHSSLKLVLATFLPTNCHQPAHHKTSLMAHLAAAAVR